MVICMYRTMTVKEKINYLYKKNIGLLLGILIFVIVLLIVPLFSENVHDISSFSLKILLPLLIIILVVRLFYPVNVFSKNVQITDGYIDEKNKERFDDGKWRMYGIAKTLDGSKKTKRKQIPRSFIHGQIPVKVIVCNNKACDFIITNESYEYVGKHHGSV